MHTTIDHIRWPDIRIAVSRLASVIAGITLTLAVPILALGDRIELKDGRILEGRFAPIGSVSKSAIDARGERAGTGILMCDDGLTRTFVSRRLVDGIEEIPFELGYESFELPQRIAESGRRASAVGGILAVTPFDDRGRRIISLGTTAGQIDIVQGITRIGARTTHVAGLLTDRPVVIEMRLATSAIPTSELLAMLRALGTDDDLQHRLRIVRMLVQSDRLDEAERQLEELIRDFPDRGDFQQQRDIVRRLLAEKIVSELSLRVKAGQPLLALEMLESFPGDGLDGETLELVRERRDAMLDQIERGRTLADSIESHVESMPAGPEREQARRIAEDIRDGLSFISIERLETFERLSTEEDLPSSTAVALAMSGWLTGAGDSHDNLKLALSQRRVRDGIHDYLNAPDTASREAVYLQLVEEEAFDPRTVSRLVSAMRPPKAPPDPDATGIRRLEVSIPPSNEGGDDGRTCECLVMLPPEYDPLGRYPAIITLHADFSTPTTQIDWWCGASNEDGVRYGQAGRHGYIVIAPQWLEDGQSAYGYSAREHACVLAALREACRHVAIDSDRVFLSGHSIGADAAWDIALSHPDIWAGVVAVAPQAGRYVNHYWQNAQHVPVYIVAGELDSHRLAANGMDLDRYLGRGFDATYVEYQGRGHEHFFEEILRIFDWLGRKQRTWAVKTFECSSMRPWDNFFWWLEFQDAPPRTTVLPNAWPPAGGTRAMSIEGHVTPSNGVVAKCGGGRVTVNLSPDFVDFSRPVSITVNGRRLFRGQPIPQTRTMLEDLRTRADYQHPFWMTIEGGPLSNAMPVEN